MPLACINTQIENACLPKKNYHYVQCCYHQKRFAIPLYICGGVTTLCCILDIAKKFYTRRNNNKVNSIETGRIVIAHVIP